MKSRSTPHYTRSQAARILNLTVNGVRLLEKQGELTRFRIKGITVFEVQEVEKLARERLTDRIEKLEEEAKVTEIEPRPRNADIPASIFHQVSKFLHEGKTPVEIALEIEISPSHLAACVQAYSTFAHGFFVGDETARTLGVNSEAELMTLWGNTTSTLRTALKRSREEERALREKLETANGQKESVA